MTILYVSQQQFHHIMEWTALPPVEFLSRMIHRWPFLRQHLFEEIKVVVD